MSKIEKIIDHLLSLGVAVFFEKGKLKTRSHKEAMTPEVISIIQENKDEILRYLLESESDTVDELPKIPPLNLRKGCLSFSQQRLWLLEKIDGGGTHYNMSRVLKLSGCLNVKALEDAMREIVRRHESLRTCFFEEDGIAVQVVQSVDGFKLDCTDLSCIVNENKNTALLKTIDAESSRAFNLESDLMLRAHLFKMESEHYVLLISMHHIASDGWSRNILIRELSALYTAYASGDASPLEDLDIQYLDYSHWQRNWFQGKGFDQQLEYWKKQLADLPVVHSFPLDRPRPLSQTFNGGSHTSVINAEVTNRLNQLCRESNATSFMGLHAAFSVLLSRYSNETDIVVGTPVANRDQEEVAGLIGFFVNNLVLRTNLSAEPTFRDLLDQSRGTLVDAFKNQQIPFEKIVETIQPERSLSHSPLFQIMLAMQFDTQNSIEIPGLSLSQMERETGISNYDLTLNVMESQDGLLLTWEFNVDLFDSITIRRVADNFECLLNSLLSSPDKNVYEVDLISDREFRRQVIEWNDTKTDYSESLCIHELFERAAAEHPLSIALVFEEKAFTYNELNQKANQVAHYLIKQGINPGDLVGLCLERSPELIIGLLGILKAGAAYVPLDAEYPTERKQRIVRKAGVEHILVDECNATAFARSLLVSDALTGFSIVNPVVKRASHELAYVIFTSGSTGEPKGVAIRHNSAVNLVSLINEKFNIGPRDRLLCITSIGFDLSVYDIFGALIAGATLVLSQQGDSLDPEKLVYLLKSQHVTFWDSVPSTLAMLVDYLNTFASDVVLRDLRLAFVSGDWIPVNLPVSAKKFFPDVQVVGLGGATEATVWSNYHLVQGDTTRYVSIPYGRPLDNNTFYVLNHRGRLAPLGVVGELYIGGVGVASGYLNDQEKTAHAFVDNPFHPDLHPQMYRTGDLGRLMSDEKGRPSEMQFIGRADSQVKIRGYRVELGEIKAALMESGPVADATVVAWGNPKQLVAYVVVKDDVSTGEGKTSTIGDIRANLKQKLPGYMIPSLVALERIPLTANGKINYQALPEPDVAPREIEHVEPSTDIEKILSEIWQTVLGLERVGVNDNFFELGGHSLLAVQAITRAKAAGLSIDVRQLFTQPTLLDLANDIASSSRVVEKALDVPPNLIPLGCGMITPDMLPLVSLTSQQIRSIADQVRGGMENIQDIYPLAPLQEGILFHHMMEDREDPYVLSALFQAKDKDVAESFILALQFVVDRHDALRTAIVWKELPAPVQVVHRHCDLPVTWHEFNAEHDLQQQIQDLYHLNAQRMQISSPPLIRLHLFQDTLSEHCYLLMQLHHIASDHMGIEIIQREIVAYRRGEADALPPAAPYREFVAHLLYNDDKDNAKQFFSSMLGDVDEPTLPFDLTNIQGDGNGIIEQRQILPDNTAAKVRLLAKRLKMSPAVLFHVAWALVVGRCCGKDDVVFGTVLSGRLNVVTDSENMLGMFINTLPIRVKLQGVTSIEMVHHVSQRLSQLLEFEHTPLATALSCSQLPSDVPLFCTLINYRHSLSNETLSGEARGGDNDIQILREQERTNYPFTLCVDDYGDEFSLNIQVDSSLDAHRVTGFMLAALEGLADSLLAQPEKNVSDISILSRSEEHQLVESWNGIRESYTANRCVHELFEEHVRRQPSREALVCGEERLTYGDLNRRANQLARYLLAHENVTPDTLIGICLDRSVEMVVSILAVLKAGGAYLPLDPSYPVERLSYMLNDADLHTVITTVDFAAQLHLNDGRSLCLDDEEVSHHLSKELGENIRAGSLGLKPNHLAYVIYTSGSTGNPKGVMVEHRNITRLLDSTKNHFGFGCEDSWTLFHSFAFDFSVWELWGALGYGGKLVIVPYWISRSPGEFYELVAKEKISVLNQTPSAFSALISEDAKRNLPLNLRVIIFGGEALNYSSLEPWVKKYGVSMPELVNMYGITETTVHVTYRKITSDDIANGYAGSMIGTSLSDLDILVLNQSGALSPVGVTGEMYVGGAGLSRGYLNRDALTNERFPHLRKFGDRRYYRTGDLVQYNAEGDLEYKGRIDHQVKIRGFRVELGEIEAQLNKLNDVDGSIVLVQNTDFGEGKLIAYVASNTLNERQDDAALRQEFSSYCRDVLTSRLPAHMIPDVFVIIRKMPLTPNGKIDRTALPKPELSWQQRHYAEPATEVERQLCEVWQSVLGIQRIGRNDNFFELGGNSLLVMQVMSQSYSKGFIVEARQIFQLPTVSALAPQVRKTSTSDMTSFVVPSNLIPMDCATITPEMLPLASLNTDEIEAVVSTVPGGAKNIQDIYPLAPLQEGILFHHILNEESDPYILPMQFRIKQTDSLDRLISAINTVISRHDILRSSFVWKDISFPVQVVYRNAWLPFKRIHVETEAEASAQMERLASPENQQMNLGVAPLIRLTAFDIASCDHCLVLLQLHHLVDDVTSLGILIGEIQEILSGKVTNLSDSTPYREFVAYSLQQANSLPSHSFFSGRLGDIEDPTLPFGLTDVRGNGSAIAEYRALVSDANAVRIRKLAKTLQISPAVLFHAAWAMVVAGCSGRNDVVFGTVLSGRMQATFGMQNMVGMFINTLPIRVTLKDRNVSELVSDVKRALEELLPFEHSSLAEAQRCSGLPRETPLFSALFNYRHLASEFDAAANVGDEIQPLGGQERTNYPFSLSVDDMDKGFGLNMQVDNSLNPATIVAYMQTAIAKLVGALEQDQQKLVARLSIMPDTDIDLLVNQVNRTACRYPMDKCIHELFEAQAEKSPDAIAVWFGGGGKTYEEINSASNELAHFLVQQKGVNAGDFVGVCLNRSFEMVISILAIIKAGGAYVPIDPGYPADRMAYVLDDAKISVLLTHSEVSVIKPLQKISVFLDDVDFHSAIKHLPKCNLPVSDLGLTSRSLAYGIYTSGSTGKPKGVMIEHRSLVNRILWMSNEFGCSEDDSVLQKTPFTFDVSVWEFFWPLISGARLVLANPEGHKDPQYLATLIRDQRITIMHFVPSMLNAMLASKELGSCTSLKQIFSSGEALSVQQVRDLTDSGCGAKLYNLYGPTEASIDVSFWDCSNQNYLQHSVPIGNPIQNTQLYVLNEALEPAVAGVFGELYIGGVGLARGYINNPELTAERFVRNPYYDTTDSASSEYLYKTGDLVRWVSDADNANWTLEFSGRLDHQVKIRGFRVELGEIEHAINHSDNISQSVVIASNADNGSKWLVAYVVAEIKPSLDSPDTESFIESLRQSLVEFLPDYMIPSRFVLLDSLPLTISGKIDRKALPKPDAPVSLTYCPPRNGIEATLCRIWQEVLGAARVGIRDNFFELGGDSLSVIRLVVKMNQTLNANIKVKDVFATPNIENLLNHADIDNAASVYQYLSTGLERIHHIQQEILNDPELVFRLPDDYEDFYPLSPIQKSMVFFAQSRPDVPLYHDQFPFIFKWNNFDKCVFEKAKEKLCKKHAILRTSFDVSSFSGPCQVVNSTSPDNLVFIDLSHLSPEMQQQDIQAYCKQDLRNKFDFYSHKPLWRCQVFLLGKDNICLILSFQHAILDGWSVSNLIKELIHNYQCISDGMLSSSVETGSGDGTSSYKDYVAINIARHHSQDVSGYWANYLGGYSRTKLPFNYTGRPVCSDNTMQIVRTYIDQDLFLNLQNTAIKNRYTIKEICLAAHVYLLSLLTGDEDILTGVVTHDRPEISGGGDILGCFLNTLPLRIGSPSEMSKSQLLQNIRSHLNRGKENELFLGEIAAIVGESNPTGNPLFDTIFNFTDFPAMSEGEGMVVEADKQSEITIDSAEMTNTFFDLEVHKRAAEGMMIQLKYLPRYFHAEEIKRAVDLYMNILEAFCEDEDLSCKRFTNLDVMVAAGSGFNDTERRYAFEESLDRLFEVQVEQAPERVALRHKGQQMRYGELNERANQIAHLLISLGVRPGDRVGLILERSFDLIAGIYGILKAGAAYVPMEPSYPLARRKEIANSAGLRLTLVDRSVQESDSDYVCLNDEVLGGHSVFNPSVEKAPFSLAYIIYTSGSTGKPKGVRIAHHSVVNLISWVNREFSVTANDIMLFVTSVSFDLSVYDVFGLLSAGGSIVIAEHEQVSDPKGLYRLMCDEQVTFWDSVPTSLNHLVTSLNSENEKLNSLRLIFMSGDWIPVRLPEQAKRYFPNAQVVSLGGATEATVWSNYFPISEGQTFDSSIPYGKPIDNTRFYVLDRRGNPTISGVTGELYIAGVGVAEGYQSDDRKTQNSFRNDDFIDRDINGLSARMYKTGDLGRIMPCGNMEILGRIDHQVKVRGFRIELGEIESVIGQNRSIKESAVCLHTAVTETGASSGGEHLIAYIVPVEGVDVSIDKLKESLAASLPTYMVPKVFVVLDSLPLNANGKIDRKALSALSGKHQLPTHMPPETETEKTLCGIWKAVLNVERVGINDNFFELGGHSLLVMQIIARAKEAGLSLDARQLMSASTLGELAAAVTPSGSLSDETFSSPPNLIPQKCKNITPNMLPLVDLTEQEIAAIVQQVPGGSENIQDIYPLAPSQEGILFHHLLSNQSDPYVMPLLFRLRDKNALDTFISALKFVINHHDALRTSIHWENLSSPVQVVHRKVSLPMTWLDPSQNVDTEEQMLDLCKPENQWVDISKAPLLPLKIVKESRSGEYLVLMQLHHLIADHVGVGIIQEEVKAYQAGLSQASVSVMQYRDFVAYALRQRKRVDAGQFFKDMLGDIDFSTLAFELADVQGDGSRVVEKRAMVPRIISSKVRDVAKSLKIGPAALFHTAWAMVVAACSGRNDVVFGTVLSGRLRGGGNENIVGMFINTLPVRVRFEESSTRELVHQVHGSLRNLIPYEHTSLAKAQKFSGLAEQAPLFNAILNYRHTPPGDPQAEGQEDDIALLLVQERTNYPLSLAVDDFGDGFDFGIELQVDASIDAERIVHYVQTAIGNLVAALDTVPEKPAKTLSVLPAQEYQQQTIAWNLTNKELPDTQCIQELFERQVERHPNDTAIIFGSTTLTYAELNTRANQLARYLIENNCVGVDKLLGIYINRSVEMVVGLLAILKAGGGYVPLDPNYPESRLRYMLDDSGVSVVLTNKALCSHTAICDTRILALDDSLLVKKLATYSPENIVPSEVDLASRSLAYVIYTSGSTGKPKGVMVEHKQLINFISSMQDKPGLAATDRLLAVTSLSFDIHTLEIFLPITAGAILIVAADDEFSSPEALKQLISAHGVTTMQATPSTWKLLLESQWRPSQAMKLLCGGEAMPKKVKNDLLQHKNIELWNMYGPTETCVWSTAKKMRLNSPVSLGGLVANTQLYILNDSLQLCPKGVVGQLYIGGLGVARGYLNREDLTRANFIDNPFYDALNPASSETLYRTGDLTRWLDGGDFEYIGRVDHQVKIRGFRVELGEIEYALTCQDCVTDAVVLMKENDVGVKHLVAYVAIKSDEDVTGKVDEDAEIQEQFICLLRDDLSRSLPAHMIPAAFVILNHLPLTPNGKVDRNALSGFQVQQQSTHIAPATPNEKWLTEVWQDVLNLDRVGVLDNFFNIGGDSISIMRLVFRIKQKGYSVTVKDIVDAESIRRLAPRLKRETPSNESAHKSLVTDYVMPGNRHWYFKRTQDLELWGQTYVLEFNGLADFSSDAKKSVELLVETHEGLRIQVFEEHGEKREAIAREEEFECFYYEDFSAAKEDVLRNKIDEFKKSIKFSESMVKFLYCHLGESRCDQLVIVIHHFALDQYASGILVNDFLKAFDAFSQGQTPALTRVGSRFSEWVTGMNAWLSTAEASESARFWNRKAGKGVKPLKTDFLFDHRVNSIGNLINHTESLSLDDTQKLHLLSEHQGYQELDFIMSAVAKVFSEWSGDEMFSYELVTSGRESFDGLDLSGTVGWLNDYVPVLVSVKSRATVYENVQAASQSLKECLAHAKGYSQLKYVRMECSAEESMAEVPAPDIAINYIPRSLNLQEDQYAPGGRAMMRVISVDEMIGHEREAIHKLSCTISFENGLLTFSWNFGRKIYREETIENLSAACVKELIRVIETDNAYMTQVNLADAEA